MKVSTLALGLFSILGLATAQSCPETGVNGYASAAGGTTGGGNAAPIIVTDAASLKAQASSSGAKVIVIKGTINAGKVSVASDKTIRGFDEKATLIGGFDMNGVKNLIFKNLNIQATAVDGIASRNTHHVWYDHLNIWDAGDGLLDITIESDYQTVSWCKFWYTSSSLDHRLACLVGSGGGDHPEDEGKLRTTWHHNWWSNNVSQRMPRVMYGDVHVYNNYYNSSGNGNCVGFGSYGSVLIQNNYFKSVNNPHEFQYDVYAYAEATGNTYDSCTGKKDAGQKGSRHASGHESFKVGPFTPPYSYSLEAASGIPALVQRCAGPRPSSGSTTTAAQTTSRTTTTASRTTTTTSRATTTGGNTGNCAAIWGQCGGIGWTGPTCCTGSTCTKGNDYYYQCL